MPRRSNHGGKAHFTPLPVRRLYETPPADPIKGVGRGRCVGGADCYFTTTFRPPTM